MDNYFYNNQGIIIISIYFTGSFPSQGLQHNLHTRTESLIPGASVSCGIKLSHISRYFRKRLCEILGSDEESHCGHGEVYAQGQRDSSCQYATFYTYFYSFFFSNTNQPYQNRFWKQRNVQR